MKKVLLLSALLLSSMAHAATQETVKMNKVSSDGSSSAIGTVSIQETPNGLLFTPDLKMVPTGLHGFHVHENASCDHAMKEGKAVAALAAGGHYDPTKTGKHLGPYSDKGHLGDLPVLTADADGNVLTPVLAPRIKTLAQIKGHALMIHAGGDNYSDEPKALGGGGDRFACGIIE